MIAESLRHHLGDLSEVDLDVVFELPDGTLAAVDTFRVADGKVVLFSVVDDRTRLLTSVEDMLVKLIKGYELAEDAEGFAGEACDRATEMLAKLREAMSRP